MGEQIQSIIAVMTIPSITLLGCVTAHIYAEYKGFKTAEKFFKRFLPKRNESFYVRVEFGFSALVGTCIGIILYSPATSYQALAAGVGWTAAFNLLKADKVHGDDAAAAEPETDPAPGT